MEENRDLGRHGEKYKIQEKLITHISWLLGRKLSPSQEHCLGPFTYKTIILFDTIFSCLCLFWFLALPLVVWFVKPNSLMKWSEVAQSCPTLSTLWTVVYQAPPSMGFSKQEYWSGLPFTKTIRSFISFCNALVTSRRQVLDVDIKYMLELEKDEFGF